MSFTIPSANENLGTTRTGQLNANVARGSEAIYAQLRTFPILLT
jgi:hypothetical protein